MRHSGGATVSPIYKQEQSLDLAIRVARVLAQRAKRVVYVGSAVVLANVMIAIGVEEEVSVLRRIVDTVGALLDREVTEHGAIN